MRLALQLKSFHDLLKTDLRPTLAKIAEAGFRNVEVTEFRGASNDDFASALQETGLSVVSLHTQLHELRARFDAKILEAKLLGTNWIVIPVVQLDEYASGWVQLGSELKLIGQELARHNLKLAFHTNAAEFRPEGDHTGLDSLFAGSDQELEFEFDLSVAINSGFDPAVWINKLTGHVPLLNLDMTKFDVDETHPMFKEWLKVSATAKACGIQWLILIEDQPLGDRIANLANLHQTFADEGITD